MHKSATDDIINTQFSLTYNNTTQANLKNKIIERILILIKIMFVIILSPL